MTNTDHAGPYGPYGSLWIPRCLNLPTVQLHMKHTTLPLQLTLSDSQASCFPKLPGVDAFVRLACLTKATQ